MRHGSLLVSVALSALTATFLMFTFLLFLLLSKLINQFL